MNEFEQQPNLAEEQAYQLTRCAIAMDQARQNGGLNSSEAVQALNENLETWVVIRTFAMRHDCPLPKNARDNLVDLSQFVAGKVFTSGQGLTDELMQTLININLQISEGFLEGQTKVD